MSIENNRFEGKVVFGAPDGSLARGRAVLTVGGVSKGLYPDYPDGCGILYIRMGSKFDVEFNLTFDEMKKLGLLMIERAIQCEQGEEK